MSDAIFPKPDEFSNTQLAADPILRYFHYRHLPPVLQAVSAPFCGLAGLIVREIPRNAERTVALRKLLEAKDAAVRANVPEAGAKPQTFYDRLLAESKELEGRLEKLDAFFESTEFARVPLDQQNLLHAQRAAMFDYSQILGRRIAALASAKPDLRDPGEAIDENVRVTGGGHSETPIPFSG